MKLSSHFVLVAVMQVNANIVAKQMTIRFTN